MSDENTKTDSEAKADSSPSICSVTLGAAIKMIEQQEYLMKRQDELLSAAIRANRALASAANEYETENAKLRKELNLYERRKAWGFLAMFIPSVDVKF